MKVILSESQILNILNEITSEQRMNFLLDKISHGGLDSLTPAEKIELRMLSGEDVGSDEENSVNLSDKLTNDSVTDYDEDVLNLSNVVGYIFENFPDGITFEIGHVSWEAFVDKDIMEDDLKISVTDGERLIDIFPFKDGESKLKVLSTERKPFGVNVNSIPTNTDEVEYFMRSFINVDIPKIITYVLKTS